MTTIWCGLALVAVQVGLSLQAQTLLAPSFTAAQAAAGRDTYGRRYDKGGLWPLRATTFCLIIENLRQTNYRGYRNEHLAANE